MASLVSSLGLRQDARRAYGGEDRHNIGWLYDVRAGKCGLTDRSLAGEAAWLEVSLVRFSARLRVMALRYFKSLAVLIWTFIVLSIFVWFLRYAKAHNPAPGVQHLNELICLTAGLFWAGFTPTIVNLPLRWIRKFGSLDTVAKHGDIDLSYFELVVIVSCVCSFIATSVGLIYYYQFLIETNMKNIFVIIAVGAIIALSLINLAKSVIRFRG